MAKNNPFNSDNFILIPRPLPGFWPSIYAQLTANFIKQYKCTILEHSIRDINIYGGIRTPHLHYKDDIYLMNADQWSKFSKSVLADVKTKITNAKEISFEQVSILANVAGQIR
jgi:hypothetical protein